ncbi:sensor histidine kinase [Actinoallomurus soli]|uniref:sensor histidine kinase n=1 Tax=Actinoallomurus soli TaxID=2952535 RepID=UPI00209296C5|nr:sensor histidine kinase [Actinoallomurus soli]MCO5973438.1 sensor histidine kinase [Actinoallomurus soli]
MAVRGSTARAGRPVTPADMILSAGVFAVSILFIYGKKDLRLEIPLSGASAALLLAKKRLPLVTLAGCLLCTAILAVHLRWSYPMTPATFVALYAVGRYCSRATALAAAVGTMIIGFTVSELIQRIPSYTLHNVRDLGWVVFAVLAGAWVQTQSVYVRDVEERAERAERERDEEALRRVAEERVRIARELHDIVGHALMSINVLASVSSRIVERNPEACRDAMGQIKGVSNSALREIRSTLSLLREGAAPLKNPERGIEDLPALIEQVRLGGLPVTFKSYLDDQKVPAIVGFTVYRIVQESLTNVCRHAKDVTKIVVAIACANDHLDVSVVNDGAPAAPSEGGGIGIQGMRERVTAIGGRLDTTALPGGGFRVHARLPLKETSA